MPIHRAVLCNDDGVDAPGIAALAAALAGRAELTIVAPRDAQSGVGHAVTEGSPIAVDARAGGRFAVAGTPADCARIALHSGSRITAKWAESRSVRDLWLVSGINRGANLGIDTYISGTAAAAREAASLGFPAIAISQYARRHCEIDWERSALRAQPVLEALMKRPPRPGCYWNVNLPHPPDESVDCEIVHCSIDPSPADVRFEQVSGGMLYSGDFHARPRLRGLDIDVCFSGSIAVSEVSLSAHLRGEGPP